MIEQKIKELKDLNKLNDGANSKVLILERDNLIMEIEKDLENLKDFYNWKAWINEKYKSTT